MIVDAPNATDEAHRAAERTALDDLDRGDLGEVDAMVEVVDVDVPRVELARVVVVELEQVAARVRARGPRGRAPCRTPT